MAKKQKDMSFLGHLEELRWHLVRSASAIFIIGILLFIFQKEVYEHFLLAHRKSDFITYQIFCDFFSLFSFDSTFCNVAFADNLISLKPTQQLMNAIWSSFILGIILSFPYLLWEIWRFISPGLTKNEIKSSKGFIFIASFLFFCGHDIEPSAWNWTKHRQRKKLDSFSKEVPWHHAPTWFFAAPRLPVLILK